MISRLRRSYAVLVSVLFLLAIPFLGACNSESSSSEEKGKSAFVFAKNDTICLVGGGVAERMQHHGWLESYVQRAHQELDLSFYNLGFGADELTERQRTQGFMSMDEYLKHCGATVVFGFFGYNESFKGKEGLSQFQSDLSEFADHIQEQSFVDGRPARLVLFTIPPHEEFKKGDASSVDTVAADEANRRIQLYNDIIKAVAKEKGVYCVDNFDDMLASFDSSASRLTINGYHLTEAGNRSYAKSLAKHLGFEAIDDEKTTTITERVVAKNELWFQRYRATDGYNVYGGRSSLKYVDGVSNYEVLQKELRFLDALVKRHNAGLWDFAKGGKGQISRENLPSLQPVVTNIPGENPDGSHRFKTGVGAIEDMTVGKGLNLELFASEEQFPELVNPVQMSWDNKGRLWVAVWPTYPHWTPGEPMNDKLLILEDTDKDGKADVCKVFADGLHNPTGFEFWQGGVYLANAPDLLFLEDRDGDDVCDVRTRVLHGLSSADTHHAANSFVIGQDGALYFQEGTFHQSQIETIYGPIRNRNGCVWRLEPRTWRVERYVAYNFANPHGHVFDRWGQDFVTDGTGNQNYFALPFSGHVIHPDKHRGYGTFFPQRCRPAAATEILSSQAFGEEFEGDYLIANVIGFRGILRYQVDDKDSGFGASEVEPIVFSSDENFRPSDLETGPDGALYFLDWHNPIIGHMQHHIRDPNRDRKHGRVYRVTKAGASHRDDAPIAGQPIDKLLDLLAHPENRVRYRARAELSTHKKADVMSAMAAAVTRHTSEHYKLELLWLAQQFNDTHSAYLNELTQSSDYRIRSAVVRHVRGMRHRMPDAVARLKRAANDPHSRVRLEAVVAASFIPTAESAGAALDALSHPMDRFLKYAMQETMRTLEPHWRKAVEEGQLVADSEPGQRFLLSRVDPQFLTRLPGVPAVWKSLLTRPRISLTKRQEALVALLQNGKTSRAKTLLQIMAEVNTEGDEHKLHTLRDLGALLQSLKVEEIASVKPDLLALRDPKNGDQLPALAEAALITLDGNLQRAWNDARESMPAMERFLIALPMVTNKDLTAAGFDAIRPLMFDVEAVSYRSRVDVLPGLECLYYEPTPKNAQLETIQAMTPKGKGRASAPNLRTDVIARPDRYGLWFRGQIKIEEAGRYQFFTRSDDGSMLYIDGRKIVSNDGPHGAQEKSGAIQLTPGLHNIDVTFFEQGGAESLRVSWQGPSFKKQVIPSGVFFPSPSARIRSAAIRALAEMKGNSKQKMRDAARLFGAGMDLNGAVALARSVAAKDRTAEGAKNMIDSLAGHVASLEKEARTAPEVVAAVELGRSLCANLPGQEAQAAKQLLDGLAGAVILVRTLPHQMLYDRREIFVEAGKPCAIVFQNNDLMPHNFVVTKPGMMQKVGEAAGDLMPDSKGTKGPYVPNMPEVLWHTGLLKPGDSTRLVFVAPEEPGEMDYVCTFPGHWRVMNGVIKVVAKLEPGANKVIESEDCVVSSTREFVKDWQISDFKPLFQDGWKANRSAERGMQLFRDGGCIQCHRHGDLGDAAYLDLSEIGKKYQGFELASHIVEPSKSILEGYSNNLFDLGSGRPVIGRIIKEDDASIHVNRTIQDPKDIVVLKKADVKDRRTLKLSLMPTGLLVTMQAEEILDLIFFLGGQ